MELLLGSSVGTLWATLAQRSPRCQGGDGPCAEKKIPIARALEDVEAGGATAVIHAIYQCLKRRWATGRPRVVLFTDGEDAGSWLENEDVLQAVRESSTLLYVVGTVPSASRATGALVGARAPAAQPEPGYIYLLRQAAARRAEPAGACTEYVSGSRGPKARVRSFH